MLFANAMAGQPASQEQPGGVSLAELQLRSFTGPDAVTECDEKEKDERRRETQIELGVVLLYLAGGPLFYSLYEEWPFVDALYFVIVTIGTVGYGDILPSDNTSKLFTVAYVIVGVILLTASVGNYIAEAAEALAKKEKGQKAEAAAQGTTKTASCLTTDQRRLVWAVARILLLVAAATIFYAFYTEEEISWCDAFYMSIMTVTTVGYGDISPLSRGGRICACFWVLLGVMLFANCVNVITGVYVKKKTRQYQQRRLSKKITEQDMLQFGGTDGELDRCEFALMKLLAQEKIGKKDLAQIWQEFDLMDIDNSGTLDKHDIVGSNPSTPSNTEASCPAGVKCSSSEPETNVDHTKIFSTYTTSNPMMEESRTRSDVAMEEGRATEKKDTTNDEYFESHDHEQL